MGNQTSNRNAQINRRHSTGQPLPLDRSIPQPKDPIRQYFDPIAANLRLEDPRERESLLAIFHSTNGSHWDTKTHWTSSIQPIASWKGVKCLKGKVVGLELSSNSLMGSIPPFISLKLLKNVALSGNMLSGEIPWVQLCKSLPLLTRFDINQNTFHGSIDWEAITTFWPELRTLNLSENQFIGPLPSAAVLPLLAKLTSLDIGGNKIEGAITKEFFLFCRAMLLNPEKSLVLRSNDNFWFDDAAFHGLDKLQRLEMINMSLHGEIRPAVLTYLSGLVHLDLSWNTLSGSIPDAILHMSKLRYLNLSHNRFSGQIPHSISKLKSLRVLNLGFNTFSGTLPSTINELHNLEQLEVSINFLSGLMPYLAHIHGLAQVSTTGNDFEGAVYDEIQAHLGWENYRQARLRVWNRRKWWAFVVHNIVPPIRPVIAESPTNAAYAHSIEEGFRPSISTIHQSQAAELTPEIAMASDRDSVSRQSTAEPRIGRRWSFGALLGMRGTSLLPSRPTPTPPATIHVVESNGQPIAPSAAVSDENNGVKLDRQSLVADNVDEHHIAAITLVAVEDVKVDIPNRASITVLSHIDTQPLQGSPLMRKVFTVVPIISLISSFL